jgi:hypothetical protein
MIDNEMMAYYITAMAIIVAAILMYIYIGDYPVQTAINGTHAMVVGGP